ncbi:hypothetical protein HN020_15460 [Brevibacillus borstelensis]|uniref:hypothetical protein n=1 Tax=Brevibacillus borstelensis TaxID=45462 RepID=UPI00046AE23C|nr:hypothetical protein [Brevibacillus borstelensis]MCC0567338.1 hypothetical protein [Brevibacillus borstelensis]MCM3471742.1 hypothetical protein [Brevibacillus borstelensis]MCM3559755.1 hypothetical protein [Brevibacillus borstelensis]MCM3593785.1 hypothetical protein [Brevibacillus borstelensis]MCM3625283.1 hypothetical protein [Brevibacillus borstelensis]
MKKGLLASMITVMLLSGSFVPSIQAAESVTNTYRVTYKMPTINTLEEVELFYSLLKDSLQVKNPSEAALVEKNRMSIYEIVGDLYATDSIRSFMIDEMYQSRKGYLLELYNHIEVLEPVYPAGYDPVAIKQQIAQLAASGQWEQYSEFRKKRGQIELDSRIKALVQAGFVMPEELNSQSISKQFAADTLYRIYKNVRPYKGSVAPKDSQSEAVRWAIEVGLPGFQVDAKGYIFPDQQLYYQSMFDYIYLFLPSKINGTGREYFQFEVNQDRLLEAVKNRSSDLLYVNNKPLSSLPDYVLLLDRPEVKKAGAQLSADLGPKLIGMIEQVRREVLKPRVWDWRNDVIRHSSFTKLVQEYRKTKSQKALMQVYQAVKERYNLFDRQDSPQVMKSVLDNIK